MIKKQEGLYQNKVNPSLIFTCNCKMGYFGWDEKPRKTFETSDESSPKKSERINNF